MTSIWMTHFPSSLASRPPGNTQHLDIQSRMEKMAFGCSWDSFINLSTSLMGPAKARAYCLAQFGSHDHTAPGSVAEGSGLCLDSLVKYLLQ